MATITIKPDKPMVLIPADEYDSMRETIEILSDSELVADLGQGLKDIAAGKTRKLSELRRERRARNGD